MREKIGGQILEKKRKNRKKIYKNNKNKIKLIGSFQYFK